MTAALFSSLPLHPALLETTQALGYTQMTPIQAASLPAILAGQDVIAQGKTGSGKTAAFGLGLLQALEVERFRIQALVLCPTRELADQVASELRRLARSIHNIKILTLCGGVPLGPQAHSLSHGAHMIVGTPGRIEDHLARGHLDLRHVKQWVLDEADRMLEMGFQEALEKIVAHLPETRQTLLFSATFPPQIQTLSAHLLREPQRIQVQSTHEESSITQHFYQVEDDALDTRLAALKRLLLHYVPTACMIFSNTKVETQTIADFLADLGFDALALHGDMEQKDRDQTLVRFANQSANVLVATDVAARGLDISTVDLVINLHIARDLEVHVHRIGRTGRAGKSGMACSLYAPKEAHKLARLGEFLGQILQGEPLPEVHAGAKPIHAAMRCLQLDAGKKQKIRAGDIVGALTQGATLSGEQIGKIQVMDHWAFVAIPRPLASLALDKLSQHPIKGKHWRARLLK
jgi:ATP-independent RNA helicase DbpA